MIKTETSKLFIYFIDIFYKNKYNSFIIRLYYIYSVVINKCQCEFKSEDKMEKQINEKKALVPKAF